MDYLFFVYFRSICLFYNKYGLFVFFKQTHGNLYVIMAVHLRAEWSFTL